MKILLIVSLIGLVGCTKQIDRLTGGDSKDETCAKYPWVCQQKQSQYSQEFCDHNPSLDVCGGDQGGFRGVIR